MIRVFFAHGDSAGALDHGDLVGASDRGGSVLDFHSLVFRFLDSRSFHSLSNDNDWALSYGKALL